MAGISGGIWPLKVSICPICPVAGRRAIFRALSADADFLDFSNRPYSRKKKRHTPKTQLLVSLLAGEIIALAFSNGKKHDFQLFKDSGIHVKAETVLDFIGLERGRILATRDWPYCST